MSNEIQFEAVSKTFGDTPALREIGLDIPGETTTALVGPTGSGKSTLLQTINGLVRPDRGTVRIGGTPIDYRRLREIRRKIGYAVQGSGLFPHLTAMRNICLPAVLVDWDAGRVKKRAEELMRLVDLSPRLAEKYPHELSGGEQQRVGLSRAMLLDPPVFLLDEPFGSLDPITRTEIHAEFLKLQRLRPRTIILVTHDLKEAVRLAHHLVVLHRGRVEQAGPVREVLENPASGFVTDLFRTQLADSPLSSRDR